MATVVTPVPPADQCRVIVAGDRRSVSLAPPRGACTADVRIENIIRQLRELGLEIEPKVLPLLNARAVDEVLHIDEPLCIAEATVPIDEVPPHFQAIVVAPPEPDPHVDQYHRCRINMVHVDQPIARLIPAQPGKCGIDVFGKPIPFRAAAAPEPQLGENVRLDQQSGIVSATCDGSVTIEPAHVHVENLLQIKSSVDFSTGSIEFNGDVMVDGGVADLFEIKARNITIHKAVEAATIAAAQRVHIDGGVLGKEKGSCSAGGDLAARFISNATVQSGGSITVLSEINNSIVTCRGKLTLSKGSILKSRIRAEGGAIVHAIGSAAELPTTVQVGPDDDQIQAMAHKLELLREQQMQVISTCQSLERVLQHPARLTDAQKEKGRFLLTQATTQDHEITANLAAAVKECHVLLEKCNVEIEVTDRIYPGAIVRFPGLEAAITTPIRGPMRIAVREVDNLRRIVVISQVRHLLIPLEGVMLPSDRILRRLALVAGV